MQDKILNNSEQNKESLSLLIFFIYLLNISEMLLSILKAIFWYCIITGNYEWMSKFQKNKAFHSFAVHEAFVAELHFPKDLPMDDNYLWKISFAVRQIKGEELESYVEVTRWDTNYHQMNPTYYGIAMDFNRKYENYLTKMMENGYPYDILCQKPLEETRYLLKIYDVLDDINRTHYYLYQKRIRCVRLKYLIGEEAYKIGYVPPCVPIWYFPIRE